MAVSKRYPQAPSASRSWLTPWNVAVMALLCFMAGMLVGANFLSTKHATTQTAASTPNLPPGHPPIDVANREMGMAAPTDQQVANPHEGADPSYDDPKVRAEIENANSFSSLVAIGNREFDATPRHSALAAAAYEKALKLQPNDANVTTDLGTVYRDLGRYDDALAAFRKAAAISPTHATSRYNEGVVLRYDKHDLRGAIAAWEEYLKLAPTGPQADQVRKDIEEMRAELKSR